MEELISLLRSIYPLSQELIEHLYRNLQTHEFKKKSFLLKSGHVCRNIFFIETGLVRCFYIKQEKEICSWFMKEEDVAISVESFFKQIESYESIQALEDCLVYFLTYQQLIHIYDNYPEFNYIGRTLTERYYILSEQRLFSLRMQTAADRYSILIKTNPELIDRVPSRYLATYLGITLETLSRVKAQTKTLR